MPWLICPDNPAIPKSLAANPASIFDQFQTNYFLLGTAPGFSFTTAFAAISAPELTPVYGGWAITLTVAGLLMPAFGVEYVGLLFERGFLFTQANHPQNLYYQVVG